MIGRKPARIAASLAAARYCSKSSLVDEMNTTGVTRAMAGLIIASRGLPADLQNDIVQEIEALLGRQSIQDLDFEAVEMAARRQALRPAARALEQRLNAVTTRTSGSAAQTGLPRDSTLKSDVHPQ